MLSCREVTVLCSQSLDEPLGLAQRWRLRCHLMMCAGCTNFRHQLELLRNAAHDYAHGAGTHFRAERGDPGIDGAAVRRDRPASGMRPHWPCIDLRPRYKVYSPSELP